VEFLTGVLVGGLGVLVLAVGLAALAAGLSRIDDWASGVPMDGAPEEEE
jgi:hypothetical protein